MTLDVKTALVVGFAGAIGSSHQSPLLLANAGCDIIGVDKAKQDSVQISIDKIKKSRLIFFPFKLQLICYIFFTLFDKY